MNRIFAFKFLLTPLSFSASLVNPFFSGGDALAFLEDWIRKTTELEPTTKLFIYALADFADAETGECWPSQKTIATAMSMSVATVQRELQKCLELGMVEVRRRWRKSNVYRLLCVKRPELSTMTSSDEVREQPPQKFNNVRNAVDNRSKPRWVPPQEISLLLADIGDVVGDRLLDQNKGFYMRIIRSATSTYEIIQDCLRMVKISILEGEVGSGSKVTNPSGLFWWALRQAGVRI